MVVCTYNWTAGGDLLDPWLAGQIAYPTNHLPGQRVYLKQNKIKNQKL